MITALVLEPSGPAAPDLAADLGSAGIHVLGASPCHTLVHDTVQRAPDLIVCWQAQPDAAFWQVLQGLQSTRPTATLVFTADASVESLERALSLGVAAWVVHGYAPQRLRTLAQLAQARARHERGLREAFDDLNRRFDERRQIERAKGILMRARQIPEDEAFQLLRSTAMQAQQRVGQVSQQLIDAARDAEVVSRSGLLRMLSQRLVKLRALQLAGVAGDALPQRLAAAREQTARTIEHLARVLSRPTYGDLLDAAHDAWQALDAKLDARPGTRPGPALAELDALAEGMLTAAERLTVALESSSALPTLNAVNLAARQRMLGERLAKETLLAGALGAAPAQAMRGQAEQTAIRIEQVLQRLPQLPIASAAVGEALRHAGSAWQEMRVAVGTASRAADPAQLADASEALLGAFEALTAAYERSMQLLRD